MTREEAIEIVRNIYQTDAEKEALAVLIPELAESEDERILDTFIEHFKGFSPIKVFGDFGFRSNQILAYLERQKEQKPKVECDRAQPVEQAGTAEPDYGICGDFVPGKLAAALRRHGWYLGHVGENQQMVEARKEEVMRNWPADRYSLTQEQKPAKWSEEDAKVLNDIVVFVSGYADKRVVSRWVEFLKSLRPKKNISYGELPLVSIDYMEGLDTDFEKQVGAVIASAMNREHQFTSKYIKWTAQQLMEYAKDKQNSEEECAFDNKEWSEEEERILDSLIRLYSREYSANAWPWADGVITYGDVVNFLNSLKSQPHWKPSEEEMEAFKKYIEEFQARAEAAVGGWNNFDIMIRLYEQLKNLV